MPEVNVGKAVGYLELDTSNFKKGFGNAVNDLKVFNDDTATLNDKLVGLSSSMGKMGSSLTKSLTLPIAGAGAAVSGLAINFETGMAKVGTIADTSVKSIEDLGDGILDISDNVKIGADELSEALYQTLSATNDTASALEYVETASKLAKGGFTDVSSAVDGATSVMNAYGEQGGEAFQKVADLMITTQNLGKTTVDELARHLSGVIPTASAMGVEFESVSASLATITAQGTPTAQATTQLNSLFAELGKNGTVASKGLQEAYEGTENAGKSFQELVDEGVPLNNILEQMKQSAEDSGLSLLDMFGSIEAGKAALQLTGTGGEKFTESLEAMQIAAGATDKAFQEMDETTGESLKGLLVSLQNVGISLGKILLPTIKGIVDSISGMLKSFREMDEGTQKIIVNIALVAAAIGPLLLVASKLISSFLILQDAFAKVSIFISNAGGAMSLLTGPIGIVIAAVAALALAWATDFGGMQEKTKEIFGYIQEIITSFLTVIKDLWENDLSVIRIVFEDVWNTIEQVFSAILDTIVLVFKTFSDIFKGDWGTVWEDVKGIFSKVWELIKILLDGFLTAIIDAILGIALSLYETSKETFNKAKEGFEEVWESINKWFEKAKEDPVKAIKSIAEDLFNAGKQIFTRLWDGMKQIWEDITGWVSEKVDEIKKKVQFWKDEQAKIDDNDDDDDTPGFRNGLAYVPYDGFDAILHEGERVLTKEENKAYDQGISGGGDTYNFYSPKALTPVESAKQMKKARRDILGGFA